MNGTGARRPERRRSPSGAVLAAFLLGGTAGCAVVVDQTITLSPAFEARATEFVVERPTRRYRDAFFHTRLGEHAIVNVDTAVDERSVRRRLGSAWVDSTLFTLLLEGRFAPGLERETTYEVTDRERFLYDLVAGEEIRASAFCESRRGYVARRTTGEVSLFPWDWDWNWTREEREATDRAREQAETRRWDGTRLECAIVHGDRSWALELLARQEAEPAFRLRSAAKTYDVELVSDAVMVQRNIRGELGTDVFPSHPRRRSGVAVFDGERQVAALSVLGGTNRLWVDDALPEPSREVLLSALYGLLLGDWLNDDWRRY